MYGYIENINDRRKKDFERAYFDQISIKKVSVYVTTEEILVISFKKVIADCLGRNIGVT